MAYLVWNGLSAELFVVSATGGDAVKVNDPLVTGGSVTDWDVIVFYRQVIWSPDGSRLAYRADQDSDDVWELYVVAASGGGAIKVNEPLGADGDVLSFAWSPDGSLLAYVVHRANPRDTELRVVPASGGGSLLVSDGFTRGTLLKANFAWSPDGSRLAYIAREDDAVGVDELYVVPVTGGGATKVSHPLAADEQVGTGDVSDTDFAWSPDGSRLGYLAGEDVGGAELLELYVVSATGGEPFKINPALVTGGNVWNFAWSPLGFVAEPTSF